MHGANEAYELSELSLTHTDDYLTSQYNVNVEKQQSKVKITIWNELFIKYDGSWLDLFSETSCGKETEVALFTQAIFTSSIEAEAVYEIHFSKRFRWFIVLLLTLQSVT